MGDSQESEKSNLLGEDADNETYTQEEETVVSRQGEQTTVSPIGPDELPPPFFQNSEGGTGVPMVTCRVCQATIDISGKRDQPFVKCSQCNEVTPIRDAPPGKKYVRCPCNCLLICESSSQRFACPRPNCKRIINLPPFLQNSEEGTRVPNVTCKVCQAMIDISGKQDQLVVKCSQCNEATAIGNAPPGKKYVRCPCKCLLICNSSSQRISCPKPNCKRIINLAPSPVTPSVPSMPEMSSVTCDHCHDTFLFNTQDNSLARCPHCSKVSSVGPDDAKGSRNMFLSGTTLCFFVFYYLHHHYVLNDHID